MLRLARTGLFFNKNKFARPFVTSSRLSSNHVIGRAFGPKDTNLSMLSDLEFQKSRLTDLVKKNKEMLDQSLLELSSVERKMDELKAPFKQQVLAMNHINEIAKIITNGIYRSILNGSNQFTDGPSWGYDQEVLSLFNSILEPYKITLKVSNQVIQRESSEYLHVEFPEKFTCDALMIQPGNKPFNEWVHSFDEKLRLSYQSAKEKVELDFSKLKDDLINGQDTAVSKHKPCPAALARIKDFAEEKDITISVHGDLIMAEGSMRPYKLGDYSF